MSRVLVERQLREAENSRMRPYWFTEQPEWLRNSTSYQQDGLSTPFSDHQFLFESPLSHKKQDSSRFHNQSSNIFENIWFYVGFSNDWTVLTQSDVKGMWLDDLNSSFKVTCLQEGSERFIDEASPSSLFRKHPLNSCKLQRLVIV